MDVKKIESLITDKTVAIMPVHVYGHVCDVEAIEKMLFHARSYDMLPPGEEHYTSRYINAATSDVAKASKNYSSSETRLFLNRIMQKEFDFIHDDPDYLALVDKYIN